ncbi:MAG: GNAT family N-acetyltransferase [Rubrivivax sp.]
MNHAPDQVLGVPGWSIRAWRVDDVAALARAANDERILGWMSDTWPSPYTEEDARWWIETGQYQSGAAWAVCLHDVPRGGVGMHPLQGFLRCNVELIWLLSVKRPNAFLCNYRCH